MRSKQQFSYQGDKHFLASMKLFMEEIGRYFICFLYKPLMWQTTNYILPSKKMFPKEKNTKIAQGRKLRFILPRDILLAKTSRRSTCETSGSVDLMLLIVNFMFIDATVQCPSFHRQAASYRALQETQIQNSVVRNVTFRLSTGPEGLLPEMFYFFWKRGRCCLHWPTYLSCTLVCQYCATVVLAIRVQSTAWGTYTLLQAPDMLLQASDMLLQTPDMLFQALDMLLQAPDMLLQASYMLLHAPDMLLQALYMLLQAPDMLLRAPGMLLQAPDMLLQAPGMLLHAPHVLVEAPDMLLHAPHMLLQAPDMLLQALDTLRHAPDMLLQALDILLHAPTHGTHELQQ
jgi:hypothetical protein